MKELVARLRALSAGGKRPLTPKEALVLRLDAQYPADVGVLSAFFLNLVTLKAGQARRLRNMGPKYVSLKPSVNLPSQASMLLLVPHARMHMETLDECASRSSLRHG